MGSSGWGRKEWSILAALIIIATLVAWPVLANRAQQTREINSIQNLRQWGIALNLYLVENENTLPSTGTDVPSAQDPSAWYNALPLYISLTPLGEAATPEKLLQRPWSDPSAKRPDNLPPGSWFFSYAMNQWLQPDPEKSPWKIYEVENPGGTVFFMESSSTKPWIQSDGAAFRYQQKGKPAAHVLFCDGHVEKIEETMLMSHPASDPSANPSPPIVWPPLYGAPSPQ